MRGYSSHHWKEETRGRLFERLEAWWCHVHDAQEEGVRCQTNSSKFELMFRKHGENVSWGGCSLMAVESISDNVELQSSFRDTSDRDEGESFFRHTEPKRWGERITFMISSGWTCKSLTPRMGDINWDIKSKAWRFTKADMGKRDEVEIESAYCQAYTKFYSTILDNELIRMRSHWITHRIDEMF